MNTCQICGYPIPPPNQAYGYVGPVCMGHTYQMPYYHAPPLSAEDVRRIVREEIERAQSGKTGSEVTK